MTLEERRRRHARLIRLAVAPQRLPAESAPSRARQVAAAVLVAAYFAAIGYAAARLEAAQAIPRCAEQAQEGRR